MHQLRSSFSVSILDRFLRQSAEVPVQPEWIPLDHILHHSTIICYLIDQEILHTVPTSDSLLQATFHSMARMVSATCLPKIPKRFPISSPDELQYLNSFFDFTSCFAQRNLCAQLLLGYLQTPEHRSLLLSSLWNYQSCRHLSL